MYIATYFCYYSFHNKLKTNPRYLNHHVNRRCDDLIEVLMMIEYDIFYDRKRKEVMMSSKDASVKVNGGKRHANGNDIPDLSVKVCQMIYTYTHDAFNETVLAITDIQYEVQSSEKDKKYSVHILSGDCTQKPSCIPYCQEQTCVYLCRHMLKCTYIDYVQGHLCKHVHKVCAILKHRWCKSLHYVDQYTVKNG